MPARETVIQGINEVGAVRGGSDESFGRTAPNGATIAFSGTDLEVESGQSTFLETLIRTADRIDVTIRLLYADAQNLVEALGLPDSALTGDLQAATPTAETIAIIEDVLGAREETLYVIGPGPSSTRRWEFARTKRRAGVTIEKGKDNEVILEFTCAVLRPTDGSNVIDITDAV